MSSNYLTTNPPISIIKKVTTSFEMLQIYSAAGVSRRIQRTDGRSVHVNLSANWAPNTSKYAQEIQNKFLQVSNQSTTPAQLVAYLHLIAELLFLSNLQMAKNLVPFHAHICDTTSNGSIFMWKQLELGHTCTLPTCGARHMDPSSSLAMTILWNS